MCDWTRKLWMILLLAVSATVAIGPPNGTVGTLDFRYPDVIVYPLVDCPYEGVFPHPHDCTWYYRCYDRYGLGFFWRAYFQCEPGTVFSDQLDQCVFQAPNYECPPPGPAQPNCRTELSGCRSLRICPNTAVGTAFISTVEACSVASNICHGEANTPICAPNQLYDSTNGQCFDEETTRCRPQDPRPEAPAVVCEDQLSGCTSYNVCFPGEAPRALVQCNINTFCYHIDGTNNTRNLCPGNDMVFNVHTNNCEYPISDEYACADNTFIIGDVPCVQETESCDLFTSCETRELFLGCSRFFICGVTTRSSVCGPGEIFAQKYGACIRSDIQTRVGTPEEGYPPCTYTGIPASTTEVATTTPASTTPASTTPASTTPASTTPASSDIFDPYTYACQYERERPYSVGAPGTNCYIRELCGLGNILQIMGCDGFYECRSGQPGFENSLMAVNVLCDYGFFHDPAEKNTCITLDEYNAERCSPAPTTPNVPLPEEVTTIIPTEEPTTTATEVDIPISVECRSLGEIPDMSPNAISFYCTENSICSNGIYLGQEVVCDQHFVCVLNPATNKIRPELQTCEDPNKKYEPLEAKTCIFPNPDVCFFSRQRPASETGQTSYPGQPHQYSRWTTGGNNNGLPQQKINQGVYQHPSGLGYHPQIPGAVALNQNSNQNSQSSSPPLGNFQHRPINQNNEHQQNWFNYQQQKQQQLIVGEQQFIPLDGLPQLKESAFRNPSEIRQQESFFVNPSLGFQQQQHSPFRNPSTGFQQNLLPTFKQRQSPGFSQQSGTKFSQQPVSGLQSQSAFFTQRFPSVNLPERQVGY